MSGPGNARRIAARHKQRLAERHAMVQAGKCLGASPCRDPFTGDPEALRRYEAELLERDRREAAEAAVKPRRPFVFRQWSEAELERVVLPKPEPAPKPKAASRPRPKPAPRTEQSRAYGSQRQRILAAVPTEPGQMADIAARVPDVPYRVVVAEVHVLRRRGLVRRHGRGVFSREVAHGDE